MRYVCDAPGGTTWFQIETQDEAALESQAMSHAVEKHFMQAQETAAKSYVAPPGPFFEQDIGLKAHIQRSMPVFLTLRDGEGTALVTAMLPSAGHDERTFRPVIVGPSNTDPFPEHGAAIMELAKHFRVVLDRSRCYPYGVTDSRSGKPGRYEARFDAVYSVHRSEQAQDAVHDPSRPFQA